MGISTGRSCLGGLAFFALLVLPGCDPTSEVPPPTGDTLSPGPSSESPRPNPKPNRKPNPKPNPNPPPGLVSYDLPQEGRDLDEQTKWERDIADKCIESGQEPDCLTLSYEVSQKNAAGSPTNIPNPGPNYHDQGSYELCQVTKVRPPPGTLVKVGTVITVVAKCEPGQSGDSDTGDSGTGDSDTGDSGTGDSDTGDSDTGDSGTS